jgi:hypothetical protein
MASAVHEKMTALVEAGKNATANEMINHKFVHYERLKSGDFSSFHKGLDGLIGSPNPEVYKTMTREHCASDDSILEFRANNYNTATTSQIEWFFVADPKNPPKSFEIKREGGTQSESIAAWQRTVDRRNPTMTSTPFPKVRSVIGWPQERRSSAVGHRGRSPFPPSFFEAELREKNRQLRKKMLYDRLRETYSDPTLNIGFLFEPNAEGA